MSERDAVRATERLRRLSLFGGDETLLASSGNSANCLVSN